MKIFRMQKMVWVGAALTACVANASPAANQDGSAWKMMDEVSYDYPRSKATPTAQALSDRIWAKELKKRNKNIAATFVLLGAETEGDNTYVFTMMDSSIMGCENPPNGDGTAKAQPLYSKCPLRVVKINNKTSQMDVKQYRNFCYLNLDDEPGERAKNHTLYSFDAKTKKLYLKTTMYGRNVKSCERTVDVR